MSISDELSEIASKAIAEKKKERAREKALLLARQKAEVERLRKEREDAKLKKQLNIKYEKFLSSIKLDLFLCAWNGVDRLIKNNLYVWQIDLLKENGYRVSSNEDECKKLHQLTAVDLPEKIDAVRQNATDAIDKFDVLKNNQTYRSSLQVDGFGTSSLRKWLRLISDAFQTASLTYQSEVEFKNKNESLYLKELNRLDPKFKYIKKNVDLIDSAYGEKLISLGLIAISTQDPERLEKTERKKKIIKQVLEDVSKSYWRDLTDSEVTLIFFAVRNAVSLEVAASNLKKLDSSKGLYDDDRVINLLADFSDKTSDNRVFERFNKKNNSLIATTEHLLDQVVDLASELGLSEDPLHKPKLEIGYVIQLSQRSSDFSTFDFLTSHHCRAFKSELEQQLRSSARKGLKSLSLLVNEYEDGIEIKSAGIKKVFLPLQFDVLLYLVSADGLGYEVYEEGNIKFTLVLLWA